MTKLITDAIRTLHAFAIAQHEMAFVHLCTAALEGESWAAERLEVALWGVDVAQLDDARAGGIFASTDTSRPDGAIARTLANP